MTIVQVVPHLPPPFEGVGTYAVALAEALTELGIETRFLVPERTAEGLRREIGDAETVLLHYAGYGYQRRGCPSWLAAGLARWRSSPGTRLVTVFHEVWASGPPWRSSFWLLPLQRRIAASLVRRSGALATTLPVYADLLRSWATDIAVMPVFSTVGEPAAVPGFGERARRIVVFGGAGVRGRTWGPFLPDLARTVRELGAEEILDVGPPVDLPNTLPDRVEGVPVRGLGVLPPAEVSGLLLGSTAGFLAYPPDFLPKSTIFAAYCAHGLLPVCAWRDGRHYWTGQGDPQAIASAAREWYAGHALARQAERFRGLLVRGSAGS